MTESLKENEIVRENEIAKENSQKEKTNKLNGRSKTGFRHTKTRNISRNKIVENNYENIKKEVGETRKDTIVG